MLETNRIEFKSQYSEELDIEKEVIAFCKDKLTRYKIPAKVVKMSESEFTERFKKKRI